MKCLSQISVRGIWSGPPDGDQSVCICICYTRQQTVYPEPKHVFSSCNMRCCMFIDSVLGLWSTLNHPAWARTGKCFYFYRSFQPVSDFPLFLRQHFRQREMWKPSKLIYWPNPILHSSCQPWLIKWIPSQESCSITFIGLPRLQSMTAYKLGTTFFPFLLPDLEFCDCNCYHILNN